MNSYQGICIAFQPPAEVSAQLSLFGKNDGALPPEELHVTLAYLPSVDDVEGLVSAVRLFAEKETPFVYCNNGMGVFENGAEVPLWLSISSPGLPDFRHRLVKHLSTEGFDVANDHGYTPHMTLAYLEEGARPKLGGVQSFKLDANELILMRDGMRRPVPIGNRGLPVAPVASAVAETIEEVPTANTRGSMTKALDIYDIERRLYTALESALSNTAVQDKWFLAAVYPTYAIISMGNTFQRVDFKVEGNTVVIPPRREWSEVTQEWSPVTTVAVASEVEATGESDTLVTYGGEAKAIGDGRVGGYLVRFTSKDEPDLEGDYFDKSTDFGPHRTSVVLYHHGHDDTLGCKSLGAGLATLKIDDVGVWIEAQLDMRDAYERALYGAVQKNKMGWSSGTAGHLVERVRAGEAYHIKAWPLGLDASLTPTPAAGAELTAVVPVKSLQSTDFGFEELLKGASSEDAPAEVEANEDGSLEADLEDPACLIEEGDSAPSAKADEADEETKETADTAENQDEVNEMDTDELKALISGAVQAAVDPLKSEIEGVKAVLDAEPAINDPGPAVPSGDGQAKMYSNIRQLHFHDGSAAKAQVMKELGEAAGFASYNEIDYETQRSFSKFVRQGDRALTSEEHKLLSNQIYAPTHIGQILDSGYGVKAIKDAQATTQGALGGFAVPPAMQERIIMALPGLTAVRGNGASVSTLLRATSLNVPIYRNNSRQYAGTLRVSWGSEKGKASERNFNLDDKEIPLDIMTFFVPFTSRQLAGMGNLMQSIERDIIDTISLAEDQAFLVGDGIKKPVGILPGGQNTHKLTEVLSGDGSTLTTDGIIKLKRGMASQYRGDGVFVANSDTYGVVETLNESGTGSQKAFKTLAENGTILRRNALESEAMPDIAANAFPMFFGAMRGYSIVERPGMTMQRMQDTSTGLNMVELHVMKEVGGAPTQLWQFAVQKVAA